VPEDIGAVVLDAAQLVATFDRLGAAAISPA
jgi:hypothetical protein